MIDLGWGVFDFTQLMRGYSTVVGGAVQAEGIPGQFLVAMTSFLPTFIWLAPLLICTFVQLRLKFFRSNTDEIGVFHRLVFAGLVAVNGAVIYWQFVCLSLFGM
ncbi:MAG: hypothetical protein VW268_00695 [Rhodospirillaceae bacterium]